MTLSLDGPHGCPLEHTRYRAILLLAGGIGITPCLATFRHLRSLALTQQCACAKVHLIWTVQSSDLFAVFDEELRCGRVYATLSRSVA